MNNKKPVFVFFGTGDFAVKILETLLQNGFSPKLVVTMPDKPKGRKMILTPPPVKVWAEQHNISYITDYSLLVAHYDLFIVAEYGKIIPKEILDIPKHGTLNVHPSLLPKFRGPSPIQTAILEGVETTGVTIMLIDEEMDHGPIVAQRQLKFLISNSKFLNLQEKLAELGGKLLAEVIPKWLAGKIKPQEQDHDKATYCKKITKQDGLITKEDSPEIIARKVRALTPWPSAYFFAGPPASPAKRGGRGNERIIITDAEIKNGKLVIKRIKPEGKKEMELESSEKYLKMVQEQFQTKIA